MSRHGHELGVAAHAQAQVLASRLRALGVADAERVAEGFMTHLMRQGWRPTPIESAANWRTRTPGVAPNENYLAARDALRQAREHR